MECVVVYLTIVLADNENPSATDIQEIFESVKADYDIAVTEKLIFVLGGNTIHDVFKDGKVELKYSGMLNLLVLALARPTGSRRPQRPRLRQLGHLRGPRQL